MEEIELTEPGTAVDSRYCVGDHIVANLYNGKGGSWAILEGKITKIFVSHERGIYQLQVNNGWWCHPEEFYGRDSVTVTKRFK